MNELIKLLTSEAFRYTILYYFGVYFSIITYIWVTLFGIRTFVRIIICLYYPEIDKVDNKFFRKINTIKKVRETEKIKEKLG